MPPGVVTTTPSGPPIRSSWATAALRGVERAAPASSDRVPPTLGVGQGDPLPGCSGPAPTPATRAGRRRSASMSATDDPEQPQLPPGPEGVAGDLDPGAVKRCSSDWLIGSTSDPPPPAAAAASSSVRLGVVRCARGSWRSRWPTVAARPAAGRPGRAAARRARSRSTPCGPAHRPEVASAVAGPELDAQPTGVLQPGSDLGGDVLAVRHRRVVAQGEVIRFFQVTSGWRLPPSGKARCGRGPRRARPSPRSGRPAARRRSPFAGPCRAGAARCGDQISCSTRVPVSTCCGSRVGGAVVSV